MNDPIYITRTPFASTTRDDFETRAINWTVRIVFFIVIPALCLWAFSR